MPVDQWELLGWMAQRESNEPSRPTVFGTEFLQQAAGLAGTDALAWDAVARTAAHLRRLRYVDWRYIPTPNVDQPEPPLEFVDSAFIQRVQEIHVTAEGHAALASRQKASTGAQISIVNSTVGQVALGDIKNIDIFVILDAMERSLATVDASPEEKEQARTAIQRMRDAGGTVATSAAGTVLGAALRQALGLP
jgi:hypothetical protein